MTIAYDLPMKYQLLKDYRNVVNLIWAIICLTFLIHNLEFFPFWAAFTYSLAIGMTLLFFSSILIDYIQPRSLKRFRMGYFAFLLIFFALLSSVACVLVAYFFYYLSDIGYFPRSSFFYEISPVLVEVGNNFPIVLLIYLVLSGWRLYYEHTKLQQTFQSTQVAMLQNQLNPHFMFNVLNHIHILIRKDPHLATLLLEKYSEILRYQLYKSQKESVPLKDEIQFLHDCIKIEEIRWKGNIDIHIECSIEDDWKNIPPLICAVFVENAFKYVAQGEDKKGFVNIFFSQKGNDIEFTIENTKDEKLDQFIMKNSDSSGIGITNIKDRLKLKFPNRHHYEIVDDGTTYKVILLLKLI